MSKPLAVNFGSRVYPLENFVLPSLETNNQHEILGTKLDSLGSSHRKLFRYRRDSLPQCWKELQHQLQQQHKYQSGFESVVEQLYGSEIKAPLSALCSAGGQCSQFYEHFTASFSSDQGEFEEDYFYDDIDNEDTLSPEEASGGIPFTTPEGDHIVKLMPISDENKLEVVELDAVEAPALSAVQPVNQSGQIISLDSTTVANSSEQESDPLKTFNQTLSDDF